MRPFFIVSAVALFLGCIMIFLYPFIRRMFVARFHKKVYYRKIYRIAKNCDFYLINELRLPLDEKRIAHFDHLLFGEKYIYAIADKYFGGTLAGNEEDSSWFFYPDKGERNYINNPIAINKIRVEKLSLITGIEESMIKSIVLVNDDCSLEYLSLESENDYIIRLKDLSKLIRRHEQSDIPSIQDEQLRQAVLDIHALAKKKK